MERKLEILHYGMSANYGGVESYIMKLWEHIDRERYNFSFIDMTGLDTMPKHLERLRREGCEIYRIAPRRTSPVRNACEVKALFEKHRFDAFHFHANTLSYVRPVFTALKNGCPVIVHSHSSNADSARVRLMHKLNRRRLEGKHITRAACSDLAAKWFFGDAEDAKVYNNGIDTEEFAFDGAIRQAVRERTGCVDKLVIGHVGRFGPEKNHRFIVEVFEQILQKRGDAVLWLIGAGSGLEHIRELVSKKGLSEHVTFWGARQDIRDLCCGMDLFLFPSKLEGFPISLVEAQCAGLPCLISDSISKQVCLSDSVRTLSLDAQLSDWRDTAIAMADKVTPKDRAEGANIVTRAGLSVKDEIKRIEKMYDAALMR